MVTETLWRKVEGEGAAWLRSNFAGRVELSNWNFCGVCRVLCDVNLHYVSPVETSEQNQFRTLCAGFSLGGKKKKAESCFRVGEGGDERLPLGENQAWTMQNPRNLSPLHQEHGEPSPFFKEKDN